MWPETRKRCVQEKIYNFELQRESDSPCVINIVKTNRLRYAGHFHSKIARNEAARKTEIQVGGWGEQR
jgi:hypothetical protein